MGKTRIRHEIFPENSGNFFGSGRFFSKDLAQNLLNQIGSEKEDKIDLEFHERKHGKKGLFRR